MVNSDQAQRPEPEVSESALGLDLTKKGKQRPGTETRARGESALGLNLTKGILLCFLFQIIMVILTHTALLKSEDKFGRGAVAKSYMYN